MECNQSTFDWSPLVTLISVFIGWIVVHILTLKRERRKEKRDVAKSFIDELLILETNAIEFHTSAEYNAAKAEELCLKTERAIRRMQRIPLLNLDISLTVKVNLRRSITLNNIDLSNFQTLDSQSPVVMNIKNAVLDLVEDIEAKKELLWN